MHSQAWSDAIVRSQAMFASTIAEYYVEDDRVRLELQIGGQDLLAFRNLLPDAIYQEMTGDDTPFPDRLALFFNRDMAVYADGKPLPGVILNMGPRPRHKRDEITGEILPSKPDEQEMVIAAELEYVLEEKPDSLALHAPTATGRANIGFVLYHRGIALNDFRYLSSGYKAELDWNDPWYSSFSTVNLRRQYFAPMSGYLYVEPFEVRKEIIVRPKDLQRWVDLGLEGRETIPVELQGDIKLKAGEFLSQHHPVTINGMPVEGILDRVNFLERKLTSSRVIEPPEELDVNAAVIGAIFVYPTGKLPDSVTMDWDLWDDRIQLVPVSAVDEAGPLPQFLQRDWRMLEWKNFLKNPTVPGFETLTEPPTALSRAMKILRWLVLALLLFCPIWLLRSDKARRVAPLTVSLVLVPVVVIAFWLGRPATLVQGQSKQVIAGLLHNIYRAFDYRDESTIYDVLNRSVSGDLLADIYLETRRGLVLANQGGARAKVKNIELKSVGAELLDDGEGFEADATWVVSGSVGHWGHVHTRQNQYQARMQVNPVDGVWKITALEVLQEERL
jgi:hypothetical protein